MSKKSQQMFNRLEAGLNRFVREVGAELDRHKSLGASELAASLFSGQSNAFVLYGPNQRPGQHEQGHANEQAQPAEQTHAYQHEATPEQQHELEHEL